jgi:hypothetical protein
MAGRPRSMAARLALGPFQPGVYTFGPCVKYTLVVMMILTFGQLYFVIPSNAPI